MELLPARSTLFTREERAEFLHKEHSLIANAKSGDFAPLLKFWTEKRELMSERADRRAERLMA